MNKKPNRKASVEALILSCTQVTFKPSPFSQESRTLFVARNQTVEALVERHAPEDVPKEFIFASVNGITVPQEAWGRVRVKAGASLVLVCVPGKGKSVLGTVLGLALTAITPGLSMGLAASSFGTAMGLSTYVGGAFGTIVWNTGLSIATGIISLAGRLLVSALAPPPKQQNPGSPTADKPTLFISGARNQVIRWGAIPRLLGRHRMVPPYGALPYTETSGGEQYVRMLFCLGYGPLEISDMRIGDTDISNFKDIDIEVRQGYPDDDPITLYPDTVAQTDLSVTLTEAGGYELRTTEDDCDEISVDVTFLRGLVQFSGTGKKQEAEVQIEVQYSLTGMDDWSNPATFTPFAGTTSPAMNRPSKDTQAIMYRVYMNPANGALAVKDGGKYLFATEAIKYPPVPQGMLAICAVERRGGDAIDVPTDRITDERDLSLVGSYYETADDFLASTTATDNCVAIAAGGLAHPGIKISGKQTNALVKNVRFSVPRGQYDVRLRRLTPDADSDDTKLFDIATWTALRSIRNENPVTMPGLAWVAMRIRATNQLNGAVEQFNLIGESILPDWDGDAWVEQTTSNPASIARYVEQGNANARPLPDGRIDIEGLQEWHQDCADNGMEYNFIHDQQTSVADVLQQVASAGRASISRPDGKWGVVLDREQTVPRQHFTPRNTWGFSCARVFPDEVHAIRVRFFNRDKDWQPDERVVYDDGYSKNGEVPDTVAATLFDIIELPGVTDPDRIWRDGRYHIATIRLRPVVYTFYADFEHISCTRGDLVKFNHDVVLSGLGRARVKTVSLDSDGDVESLTIDDPFFMEAGQDYAVRIRLADGVTLYKTIITNEGWRDEVQFVEPFTMPMSSEDTDNIDTLVTGALIMFGLAGLESKDLIIKSIESAGELSARITCVDAAPAVHDADTGEIPDYDPQITIPPEMVRPPAPEMVSIQSDEAVLTRNADGSYTPSVVITLKQPGYPFPLAIRVLAKSDGESEFFPVPVLQGQNSVTILGVESGVYYSFRIIYVNEIGIYSDFLEIVNHFVIGDTSDPSDVTNFNVNVLGGTAYLSWDAVTDLDLSHYVIKFNNDSTGANWSNSILLVPKVGKVHTTVAVPAAAGTYLIKAVDLGERESDNEALIVSAITAVSGFNLVETITEDPAFDGVKEDCTEDGGTLTIDEGFTAAVYYFDNSIDLGAVYTSTLDATIHAAGVQRDESFDAGGGPWDEGGPFDGDADPSDWNVEIQVRYTDDDPTDSDAVWSDWRTFILGEYAARAFEFRALLTSDSVNITPAVSGLSVSISQPDRVQAGHDLVADASDTPTTVVTFPAVFNALTGVTITGQNMATGDYWEITNITEAGFEIVFKDSADARVTRTFDYVAAGYGIVQ